MIQCLTHPLPTSAPCRLWAEQNHLGFSHRHFPAVAELRHFPECLSVGSSACDACCSLWEERDSIKFVINYHISVADGTSDLPRGREGCDEPL